MQSNYHEEEILGKAYDSRLMKRLLKYLRPYRGWVILSVVILLVSSLAQLAGPYLTKIAIDKYILAGDSAGLFRIILLFLGSIAIAFILQYIQVYLMEYVGQKAMSDMRMQIFSHVENLDLKFFDKNPVGRIVTRITNDVQALNEMFTSGVVEVFGDIFILIGIVIAMMLINWELALVIFTLLPLVVIVTLFFKRKVRDIFRDIRLRAARMNAFVQENVTGVSEVQCFTAEKIVGEDFNKINCGLRDAYLRSVFYFAVFFRLICKNNICEACNLH